MKIFYSLFLLACVTLLGCKKEGLSVATDTAKLTGTWELRHTLGVQIANAPSDFAAGNGSVITFENSRYDKISQGKVYDSGTYSIEEKQSQVDGEEYNKVMILNSDANKNNPDKNWRVSFKIVNDQLLMAYGSIASDGFTDTYKKLNDTNK
ncbi:MAG: hypothetical protein EOP43_07940 [Sphingobacteriaceae bacterium]|nr:MAG: hypothetical protein EOP43_07940 [Sphingobacteriaceae bacterium]